MFAESALIGDEHVQKLHRKAISLPPHDLSPFNPNRLFALLPVNPQFQYTGCWRLRTPTVTAGGDAEVEGAGPFE